MKKELQNYHDKILEALFHIYHITLETLFDYADDHYDEIQGMDRIFSLETEEDVRRFLVIPRLLDPKRADAIIACFREEERENPFAAAKEPDFEQYKTMLITAFAYNQRFFKMAVEWCTLVGRDAAKHTERNIIMHHGGLTEHRLPRSRERLHRFEYKAASAAVPGFKMFGAPFEFEEGTLKTLGAKFDDYYLQFCFTPKPEANIPRPCTLDIRFTTTDGQTGQTLRLRDQADTPGDIMYSNPKDGKGIDYTRGIIIQSVEFTEAEEGGNG